MSLCKVLSSFVPFNHIRRGISTDFRESPQYEILRKSELIDEQTQNEANSCFSLFLLSSVTKKLDNHDKSECERFTEYHAVEERT